MLVIQTNISRNLGPCKKISEGKADDQLVDLRMGVVKPLSVCWLIDMYDHMKSKSEIITNGFRGSSITSD